MKGNLSVSMVAMALVAALAGPVQLPAQQHHHYKLIDMGTFGGPASSINYPLFQGTLNNRGVTTGWSATSIPTLPTSSFLICGGLDGVVPYITHTFQWNGAVTDLGAFPPSDTNCSEPFFINGKGEIVGGSELSDVDPQFFGLQQTHAVLWKDGQMIELGTLGGNQVAAFGINNGEQIVGASTTAILDPYCFFGTVQQRAFLWEHGLMQDLGTLGGNCALPGGINPINERGQIIGSSTTSSSPNPLTGLPTTDPFLWEQGKGMRDLGTLGGAFGSAQAINTGGQVVGQSSIAADPAGCNGFPDNGDLNCHAFLWDQGTLIDLTTSTTGGAPEWVAGINDTGEIVGWGVFSNSPLEAFIWRKGVATDLGHLNDCISFAHTINSQSQVVGLAVSCDGSDARAFLWEKGSIADLNTLIPSGSSLQLAAAMDINDRGEIDGIGVPPGVPPGNFITEGHGFLLIPCDENHPNVEGCDYSLTDGSASATGVSDAATGERQTVAKPALTPDVIRRLLRLSGVHPTPWRRGFGAPSLK
jgi:probable HAF family extracellular repeat protein